MTSSGVKSASFSASITVASLCVRRASSSWPSRGLARPYIREARSSGRWTRYSALPAPSDGYIGSSATNAGRHCRVSPQPRPVQGSRPDPALCHLSDISDRSCPIVTRAHTPVAPLRPCMVGALDRRDPGEWLGFVQAADRQGSRCRNQTFAKLSANASRADGSFQHRPKRGPEKEPGTFALSAGSPSNPPK